MGKVFICGLSLLCLTHAPGASAAPVRGRALFIGDIMAHKQQLEAAERKGPDGTRTWDFSPQFQRVRPLFTDALIVGNLETTFAGGDRGYAGYPSFNTPDSLTDALKDLNIDLVTVANNHIFDRGASGARRTTEVLDRAGIPWTGLGLNDIPANDAVLLEKDGLKWAFTSHSYGSNRNIASSGVHLNVISQAAIAAAIDRAKALDPDVIVACFHWGNEYHYTPSQHQKKAAEQALALGAHLVIGTHPHVLQPVEVRPDDSGGARGIAWSLGNFVSFQRTLPRERTCILSAEFEKESDGLPARLVRLAAAPLQVVLVPAGGRRRTEVVYAGLGGNFNHSGLSGGELGKIRETGRKVLDFLGAQDDHDPWGFYTLWSAASPDVLPKPRRTSPK